MKLHFDYLQIVFDKHYFQRWVYFTNTFSKGERLKVVKPAGFPSPDCVKSRDFERIAQKMEENLQKTPF